MIPECQSARNLGFQIAKDTPPDITPHRTTIARGCCRQSGLRWWLRVTLREAITWSVFGLNLERFWLGGAAHERRDECTVGGGRAGERKTSWANPSYSRR